MRAAAPAAIDPHPAVAAYAAHVDPAFVRLLGRIGYGRVFVRAKDVWLWDHAGRRYLDALAGFGAVNIGHNHPRLVARLRALLGEDPAHFPQVAPGVQAAALAEALAARLPAPLKVAAFSSGGGDAVETALKFARAETRRAGLVHCRGAFHGSGLGALSVLGDDAGRRPFGPLLPGCVEVPFGDLSALAAAVAGRRAAAFIVEPLQAEGGVLAPPNGYLRAAGEICRRQGTLLVLDEVQTGLGRTGSLFAFEREGVIPDILVLAKSLGGGVAPIGATVMSRDLQARASRGTAGLDLHGSTFSGGALACAAALETLAIVDDERLPANAAERGRGLLETLRRDLSGHPLVRDVRGRGLLIGIELGPAPDAPAASLGPRAGAGLCGLFGQWAALRLLERGIVCQPASRRWEVLRLEPPLTLGTGDAAALAEAVSGVLWEYTDLAHVARDATARLGEQFVAGWAFR